MKRQPWLLALHQPECVRDWALTDWDLALRQLRRLRLAARLTHALQAGDLLSSVPEPAQRLLLAERNTSDHRQRLLAWTARCVQASLAPLQAPKVLLKGAAYQALAVPIARGRLPADLDILVPREALAEAQRRLLSDGWLEPDLDAHDRRYYHEWSHEVPPMRHPELALELDLHHNILPPQGALKVDATRLLDRLQASDWPNWSVLAPEDQVLHAAAHLIQDGEPLERVRDIVDLDGLLRHYAARDLGFWTRLLARADELGLRVPLTHCGSLCQQILGTPLDRRLQHWINAAGWGERMWRGVFACLLEPAHPDRPRTVRQLSALLAVRSRYHLTRLPIRHLVPHLWHKWRASNSPPATEA